MSPSFARVQALLKNTNTNLLMFVGTMTGIE